MNRLTRLVLASAFVFAPRINAQVPEPHDSAATPPVQAQSAPASFARPNGMLVRPDSAVYDITSMRDTTSTPLGTRTVRVSETSLAGMPAWLVVESRTGTAVETSDSVYLSRADLAPQRWTATNGRTQLAVSFTRDSLFGGFVGYQGHSSFSGALSPDALLSPAMTEQVVLLLPLQLGYHATASLVQIAQGGVRALPATISVDHEDRPMVAGREVDCWLVTVRSGAIEERLWVSKEQPRVVRTEQAVGTGLVTSVLRM